MTNSDGKPAPTAGDGRASPWIAFRHTTFTVVWIATVVANIGTWMYNAASGWLMTSLNPDPLIVSLVQVASSLPMFLFALRRRVGRHRRQTALSDRLRDRPHRRRGRERAPGLDELGQSNHPPPEDGVVADAVICQPVSKDSKNPICREFISLSPFSEFSRLLKY
jgi:hypothetical protein